MQKNDLWHAVIVGDLDAVKSLYNEKPAHLQAEDSDKNTLLHVSIKQAIYPHRAIKNKPLNSIVYFLLNVGHPICVVNKKGETPLDFDIEHLKVLFGPWLCSGNIKRNLVPADLELLYKKFPRNTELGTVIKGIEIEQTKNQQLLSGESKSQNDEEQYQFAQKLLKLTQEDQLERIINTITIETMLLCKNRLPIDKINSLLNVCSHPTLLVDNSALQLTQNSFMWRFSLNNRSSLATKKILAVIALIDTFTTKFSIHPAYKKVCDLFSEVKQIYQRYCDQLFASTNKQSTLLTESLLQPPTYLSALDLSARYLLPAAANYLAIDRKDNVNGGHVVRDHGGIIFKRHPFDYISKQSNNPCLPGIEFLVASFFNTIDAKGYGIAHTEIVKVSQQSEEPKIFIASNKVEGTNLLDLIRERPQDIKRCDSYSFASMYVTGKLTTPLDGKFDNFMVQFVGVKGHLNNFALRIIGVDNDQSFGDPIIAEQGQHDTEILWVFFLFPQMEEKFDSFFRNQFLARSAEHIMFEWLKVLVKQDERYERLLSENILTLEEWNSLGLPIRFTPGRLSFIYLQLKKLQKYLIDNPQCTYDEAFVHLYSRIGKYYRTMRRAHQHNNNPVFEAFMAIRTQSHRDRVIILQQQDEEDMLKTSGISTAQRNDFEKRNQLLAAAIAEFIPLVDFYELECRNELASQQLLSSLQDLKVLKKLTLRNCSILDLQFLKNLIQSLPMLQEIILIHCHGITAKDIVIAMLSRAAPLSIGVYDCKQISVSGYELLSSKKNINLLFVGRDLGHNICVYTKDDLLKNLRDIVQQQIYLPKAQVQFLVRMNNNRTSLSLLFLLLLMGQKKEAAQMIQTKLLFFGTTKNRFSSIANVPVDDYPLRLKLHKS